MQPLCNFIGTLLLSALLPWPSTGQFHVIGPKAPIIAKAGEDAVLSCHLNPMMDAQNMEVKWYRNHSSALVHRYGASQGHTEQQMPEYKGRTGFLKENITKGQAALRIHSIRPSDGGEYSCLFESSTYYDDAIFEVLVTGSGMAPHIHVESGNMRDIKLTCTSTGWYPEPEVQWRDLEGQLLVPDAETKTTEANGLFHVETSVTVDKSSSRAVSCLIRNPVLSEEKEVYISVADAWPPYAWIVGFAVLLSLLVVVTSLLAVYVVRAQKAKGECKKHEQLLTKEKEEIKEKKERIETYFDYLYQEKEEIKEQKEHIKKLLEKTENFFEQIKISLDNLAKEEKMPKETSTSGTRDHYKVDHTDTDSSSANFNHPLGNTPNTKTGNLHNGNRREHQLITTSNYLAWGKGAMRTPNPASAYQSQRLICKDRRPDKSIQKSSQPAQEVW